ncbi:MAG TPA: hypothetical protein VFV19_16455 [Candidatus Polarisedimenticolaceae bacterium]|nr:hypothetical protein [Candidatus Polarisedimenticolaceae bacterium]
MRRILVLVLSAVAASAAMAQSLDPRLLEGLHWRLVGPFRGGRTVTATGVPGRPNRFYFGAVGGGVWRSDNAGRTWDPIFDAQPVASIGAVAVAPSSPDVLYVGSGEGDMRSDISYGNGMYKSVDAGATWTRIGLTDSRQIGQVLVDPHDANVVFVAALGHAYGPNQERGVFRSRDGGKTWKRVLFEDENTGAIDLAFDPASSKTILAAMWQTRRPPWNVYPPSNGPGSGLYRSVDGGDTWARVSGGLPVEKLGRIRIAFAPSDPRRVYALVDAKEGGLYVSDDGGVNWKKTGSDRRIWERGWYFAGVTVDPADRDVVYACNTALYRSTDGGKTFLPFKGAPGGDDYHRLWIDPADARRMILASDQGAAISLDGGKTWSSWYNQPTGQFYHVATDDRFPYWIYGAQQDSGAAATPVRTDYRSITERDWNEIAIGGESGYIVPDPDDPDVVWGGTVGKFDWRTLQEASVDPTLAHPGEYRGEWTLPLAISPRTKAIYFARQFLFKSVDRGGRWEKISPDLTREDPGKPANLDPVTADDSDVKGARRGVIYAIAPSPLVDARIWVGTDDGLIWLSPDDGRSWNNVTPKVLGPWSKVGIIEASHFDADTAYAAIDRHRIDDLSPEILRTKDAGKTWTSIARGIPDGSFVNVVREDPVRRGLLYAGTETGVFVSFDDGEHWQPLQANLPNCSIRDIDVRHGDLVVATHGRSFWVLDDLSPLRQIDATVSSKDLFLAAPRPAVCLRAAGFQGSPEPKDEPMAENPLAGAVIDYFVRADSGRLVVSIVDASGAVVRRYASDDATQPPDLQKIATTPDWATVSQPPPATPGMHRFVWDLRDALPEELVSRDRRGTGSGPWSPPGRYIVRLEQGGRVVSQPLDVVKDPRLPAAITDADLEHQHELAVKLQAIRVRVAVGLRQADTLRKQIQESKAKAGTLAELSSSIDRAAGPPANAEPSFGQPIDADPASLRRVASSLAELQSAVESADGAPSADALTAFGQRQSAATEGLARWQTLLDGGLAAANRTLQAAGFAALKP